MRKRTAHERLKAICCECGNIRFSSEWQSFGEASYADAVASSSRAFGRCIVWRKCSVCGDETKHAYLREDARRDEFESVLASIDVIRVADGVIADRQLEEAISWICEKGARVSWEKDSWGPRCHGALVWFLDDGVFLVQLSASADPISLMMIIEIASKIVEKPSSWLRWQVIPAVDEIPPMAVCPLMVPEKCVR